MWLYNAKQFISCKNCKVESKTKSWIIYTPLLYLSWLLLGGIFVWLVGKYHFSGKILFVVWILFVLFSPLLLMRAERELS